MKGIHIIFASGDEHYLHNAIPVYITLTYITYRRVGQTGRYPENLFGCDDIVFVEVIDED